MDCPECQSATVVLLTGVSRMSSMNHFTCATCGFAWTEPKKSDLGDADLDSFGEDGDDVVH